jgi:hypothetical protein
LGGLRGNLGSLSAHGRHTGDGELVRQEIRPKIDTAGAYAARIDFDPYTTTDPQQIINAWIPFVFAMNSVSRTMGQGDLYPFILAPAVVQKLDFMHKLIHRQL